MSSYFEPLERSLKYFFKDKDLLLLALTHSSWANENHVLEHNERLEFLGDAVLEIHISNILYLRFPTEREGILTKFRSSMVSENMLFSIANEHNVGKYLRMGKGEEAQGGRERPALLADTVESLLGAVFLDGGYTESVTFIENLYHTRLPTLNSKDVQKRKDYKTQLQEYTQAQYQCLPLYTALESKGPEHAKIFHVQLSITDEQHFTAQGSSLKKAEQLVAQKALIHFSII